MSLTYGKRESDWIKGIAIAMMLFHHLFGFPQWILDGNMYVGIACDGTTLARIVAVFCKLCVGLFAFTTGYAMYIQRGRYQKLAFRLQRAGQFLLQYWLIFALFLLFGLAAHEPLPSPVRLLEQAFGLCTATGFSMKLYGGTIHPIFAWYVSFYLLFLLLAPVLSKLSRFGFWVDNLIYFVLLNGMYIALVGQTAYDVPAVPLAVIKRFVIWGNVGMLGYLFAKYDIFTKIDHFLTRYIPALLLGLLCCAAIVGMIYLRHRFGNYIKIPGVKNTMSWDLIYTPVLIYCLVRLLTYLHSLHLSNFLSLLSRNSTNIWFLHGIFFTPNHTIQWIAYWPKYPVLIFIWTLLLSLGCSMLIEGCRTRVCALLSPHSSKT